MRFYVNLTNGAVSRDLFDRSHLVDGWVTKRGQCDRVELQFHRDTVPELLPPDTPILLGIKPDKTFDGPYLTSLATFVAPGTAAGFYTGKLPTSTPSINTALGSPNEITSDDVIAIERTTCEVEYWLDGPTADPTKSLTFSTRIENTPNNGGETEPGTTTPYPSPATLQGLVAAQESLTSFARLYAAGFFLIAPLSLDFSRPRNSAYAALL